MFRYHFKPHIVLMFFIASFSYAQYYNYMNLSQSAADSKEAVVRVDASNNLHTFWIEDHQAVYYRYSDGNTWSTAAPVYQSASQHSISALTSIVVNDTCFVFFNDDLADSTQIVCCRILNGNVLHTDTLHIVNGSIARFRSAKNGTEIAVAYSNTDADNPIYVYKYPQGQSWAVSDTIYYWAETNFSLGYDNGDTLWVFCIWDDVWSRYLPKDGAEWSEKIYAVSCEAPIDDIDCKYNPVSHKFNMLISTAKASCIDCIENFIVYSEGYSGNWSECETVDAGGSTFMAQGGFVYPFLEIGSSGQRDALYKYYYSSENAGDEYSVRLAEKKHSTDYWNIAPVLLFNNSFFTLTSAAIDTQDSLFFTYTDNGDVYLAAKDNPSSLSKSSRIAPNGFTLFPCYPNPFNPSTTIRYRIPAAQNIKLVVYNISGKEIDTIYKGRQTAGMHTLVWRANGQPSGIYFYRLESASGFRQTQKMILLR